MNKVIAFAALAATASATDCVPASPPLVTFGMVDCTGKTNAAAGNCAITCLSGGAATGSYACDETSGTYVGTGTPSCPNACDVTMPPMIVNGTVDCTGKPTAASGACAITCVGGGTAAGTITCNDADQTYTTGVSCPANMCVLATLGAPEVTDGTVTCGATLAADVGCTFTCNSGYTKAGLVTCNSTGDAYDKTGASCTETPIETPMCVLTDLTAPLILNGEVVCGATLAADIACTFTCNSGYTKAGLVSCNSNGTGYDTTGASCTADSGTTAKVCSGAIPTATLGNSKADCADATAITATCNVTCDDVIKAVATCTANADATMDPSYVTNPATLPDCAAPAENPLCDGKWTDSDDNAGSTVDCTGVKVEGKECAVACLPQLMEFGLPPKCGTLGYSKGGLCVPIAPTDAQYEKAGCKVRVATGAPLAIKLKDLLGGKKTMSLRQVMQLTSASIAQIAAGKKLSEAAFMTAIKGGGVTEAQLPDLKELMCIGSNFVTAAVALAVAFLVSK